MRLSKRRVANVIAGAFLFATALALGSIVWTIVSTIVSGPDAIDTAPLVRDLDDFAVPAGATAEGVVVTPCTGEGSVGPYAERRFVVATSHEEVRADLESQARELGWTPSQDLGGILIRHDRLLLVGGEDSSDGPVRVVLQVTTSDPC